MEQPNFEYQHIERALPIICENMDFIQAELYKNSKAYMKRNNKILYYDCTNYSFEIEEENRLKQYGKSKENRPNPIVQMGLFMDGDGIPLVFDITPGNTNEQITLKPLEEKIVKDFELSEFIVCTDAGLASKANRIFNNQNNKKFITTQSIKKLKAHLREEALDLNKGWHLPNDTKKYNISNLRTNENLMKKYKDKVFYKERWINEDGLSQRLIVTFSVKYQEYQKNIRNNQINRALKIIESRPEKLKKAKQNDPKRFKKTTNVTNDGELADKSVFEINKKLIEEEARYNGLYAVCTNLDDDVEDIIKLNHRRWEIEESFRIMKTDFKSRPVYHTRDEMIKAHFVTCYLALVLYRYLEKNLNEEFTAPEIIETLRDMEVKMEGTDSYIPNYIRTDLTDALHKKFGFRTDYEVMNIKNFKKIFKDTKK